MNKIPSQYQYSFSGNNPYGADGYSSGDSWDPSIQAYQKQLTTWYQQALFAYSHLTDGSQRAIVAQELQTARGYAASYGFELGSDDLSGGWDLSDGMGGYGMPGMGVPGQDPSNPAPQYGEMIWQDQTRMKWDGTDPVVYPVNQQADSRQQDFFQSDVTLQSPYHGAVAKAELVDDDSVAAPAKMLKVTYTMPDGSTKVVCVHNITDKSNVQIQSPDASNVHLDASLTSSPLASQVTVGDLTSTTTDSPDLGTPPDEKTTSQWTWKKNRSVDVTGTEGKETFQISSHDLNLSLLDYSQNAYITKTGENHYTIEIRDDSGKLIRRIEANAKQINLLNADSDKVFYKDASSKKPSSPSKGTPITTKPAGLNPVIEAISEDWKPVGFDAWSGQDAQISLDGDTSDTTSASDPNPAPDSISKDGKTANYNKSKDVELSAYYGAKYSNFRISSGSNGTVTLHPASYGDTVDITKNEDNTYTVVITSADDPSKQVTYIVEGPPSQIKIDGANIGKVSYSTNDLGTPHKYPYTAGVDKLITVTGEEKKTTVQWPFGQVVANIPTEDDYSTKKALAFAQKLEDAARTGNWDGFRDYITRGVYTSDYKDPASSIYWNNIIRKVITGLYKAAGSDQEKFMGLMKTIPEDVRTMMKDRVEANYGELNEKFDSDQWNSQGTAAMIAASLAN